MKKVVSNGCFTTGWIKHLSNSTNINYAKISILRGNKQIQ